MQELQWVFFNILWGFQYSGAWTAFPYNFSGYVTWSEQRDHLIRLIALKILLSILSRLTGHWFSLFFILPWCSLGYRNFLKTENPYPFFCLLLLNLLCSINLSVFCRYESKNPAPSIRALMLGWCWEILNSLFQIIEKNKMGEGCGEVENRKLMFFSSSVADCTRIW